MFTHEPTMPGIRPGPALLVMVLLAGCGGAGSTQEGAAATSHSSTLQPVERPVAKPMDRGADQPGIQPVERPVAKPLDRPAGEPADPDRS
jgi:hypothetical protein